MIKLLAKTFIKDHNNLKSLSVRRQYGIMCSILGIVLNLFLFGIKLFAGILSSSIAVIADAFNNLSDSGSSIITMIGFKLAGQKPDKDHPFGHGRFEYISALIVSLIIILMGSELVKSSITKLISPEAIEFSLLTVIILAVSILIKIYIFYYNKKLSKKFNSESMKATAFDSLCDTLATVLTLVSIVISHFTGLYIDAWCGIIVALFILYAGFSSLKDTVSSLLGKPAEPELVKNIEKTVMSYKEVVGIHDLIVHNYGPGRLMISLHAEVSEKADIRDSHDIIDIIERHLEEEIGCHAVIHMDPIAYDDTKTQELKLETEAIVKSIDERMSIHDFRIVIGNTHTNIIFDVVVPYDKSIQNSTLKKQIEKEIKKLNEHYFAVITIDRSYV